MEKININFHDKKEVQKFITQEYEKFKLKYKCQKNKEYGIALAIRENFVAILENDKVIFIPASKLSEIIKGLKESEENFKILRFLKKMKESMTEGDKE